MQELSPLQRRETILNLLSIEPRLTAKHVALLAYSPETKLINGKTYPKSYQAANNMLRRMVERKEIKVHELSKFGYPDLFMLNSTPRLKSIEKILHEIGGADLFVAFRPFMSKWAFEPQVGKKRADRGMELDEAIFYFEVDKMTEGIQELFEKVDNYAQHSRETRQRFHVVFAFLGDSDKVYKRGMKLIPYLEEVNRGNQFLTVNLKKLTENPLGEVVYSPKGLLISIKNVL
jgi:hypothetical protein